MATDLPILRARDFMQRDFIAVAPHTPILTVHRMFVDKRIHGAPVIDDHDEVVGVVSTLDLLRTIRRELEPGRAPSTSTYFWDDTSETVDHTDVPESAALWRLIVRDAMSKDVVSVDPDLPLDEVARTMIDRRIHRVLVMSGRRVVGVLTTFDLLFAMANPALPPATVRHSGYSR
ncbi:MAG: CBS domain-containing protein [Deltaproteobacteria bacterium]